MLTLRTNCDPPQAHHAPQCALQLPRAVPQQVCDSSRSMWRSYHDLKTHNWPISGRYCWSDQRCCWPTTASTERCAGFQLGNNSGLLHHDQTGRVWLKNNTSLTPVIPTTTWVMCYWAAPKKHPFYSLSESEMFLKKLQDSPVFQASETCQCDS